MLVDGDGTEGKESAPPPHFSVGFGFGFGFIRDAVVTVVAIVVFVAFVAIVIAADVAVVIAATTAAPCDQRLPLRPPHPILYATAAATFATAARSCARARIRGGGAWRVLDQRHRHAYRAGGS